MNVVVPNVIIVDMESVVVEMKKLKSIKIHGKTFQLFSYSTNDKSHKIEIMHNNATVAYARNKTEAIRKAKLIYKQFYMR